MKFSICIPTLTSRVDSLNKALDSLGKQSYKNYEVILIWKDDIDDLSKFKGFTPGVKWISKEQESGSVAGAINEGLALATGDVFVRTDDDCLFDAYWLESMKKAFELPNCGGITGPTIVPKDRRKNRDCFKNLLTHVERVIWEDKRFVTCKHARSGATSIGSDVCEQLNIPIRVDFLQNCNWAVRVDLLKIVGGFPEKYSGLSEYCQEIPTYKIRDKGYRLYWHPSVIVYHMIEPSDSRRLNAFNRLKNFWMFWHECIKPNGGSYLRFLAYFLMQIAYYGLKKVRLL